MIILAQPSRIKCDIFLLNYLYRIKINRTIIIPVKKRVNCSTNTFRKQISKYVWNKKAAFIKQKSGLPCNWMKRLFLILYKN